jgi:UDP-N-acetylmuramoylalanine--D-glutamate ligase
MTGLSVAHYMRDRDVAFAVADSRENPPGKRALEQSCPDAPVFFGAFSTEVFNQARQLIVSPGLSIATHEIQAAHANGAEVLGDIELFVRAVQQPIIAITGSNGKTTVTTLVTLMAEMSGKRVAAGGNVGIPVLDLLKQEAAELYVLELSSFQLETTDSMQAESAVILNISADHLDRYEGIEGYAAAKARIYDQCNVAIVNRDDLSTCRLAGARQTVSFGLDEPPTEQDMGLIEHEGELWFAKGKTLLLSTQAMKVTGEHNIANALAALTLGEQAGLPMAGMLQAISEFKGVRHRSEWVAEINQVNWYNDSKGTNVGATLAALKGMPRKTVLIAGGQGKGSDFTPLKQAVEEKARAVILFGEDAKK